MRYDPADPTPALAGPMLAGKSAVVDNATHELRGDVLTFTSLPLTHVIEVAGVPEVELRSARMPRTTTSSPASVTSTRKDGPGTWPIGWYGWTRATTCGADGVRTVRLQLWPCFHRFGPGHRLRLQISGGRPSPLLA